MNEQTGLYPIIVTVAMLDSPHTARWLEQFANQKYEFVLIPSTPNRRLHPDIKKLLHNSSLARFSVSQMNRYTALPFGVLDLLFHNWIRSYMINRQLSRLKQRISFIHVHEIQHAGYLVSKAIRKWHVRPKIVVSVWGSDLYWFQKFKKHSKKIRQLMSITSQLICECSRDVVTASSLGYAGHSPIVMPVSGGIALLGERPDLNPPSSRDTILVKGYTGFVGRADLALSSIERVSSDLQRFRIIVYSSDLRSRWIARRVAARTNLRITCYRKKRLSYAQMKELFQQSRIHIGISESDGIPRSLLESMAYGCFPIQSSTSCVDEFVKHGEGGFFLNLLDSDALDKAVLLASVDDDLVDNAASSNRLSILSNREFTYVAQLACRLYEELLKNY
jgi:glycosyltransferase involved in cell wall biosynthesis